MASFDDVGGVGGQPVDVRPLPRTPASDQQRSTLLNGREFAQTNPRRLPRQQSVGQLVGSLNQRRIQPALDGATRSTNRAVNKLMRELAKPRGDIKPGRVAAAIADIKKAVDAYVKAFPDTDRDALLQSKLEEALSKQRPEVARRLATNAKEFAGKAIANLAQEADRATDLMAYMGQSTDPEAIKTHPDFRAYEAIAKTLHDVAAQRLGPQRRHAGPERADGQHHLRRLMSSEDLRARLGTVQNGRLVKKQVRTLLGFTVNKRFKGLLEGLDAYQRKSAQTMRQTGHSRWRQGAELKGVLDDLEKKVDAYEAKHPERKATTDALRAQIATERRLIDQVVAHGSGFRSQIAGQTISDETLHEASQTPTWANTTSLMAMKAAVGGRTTDQEVRLRGGQGFDSGAVNSVDLVRYQDGSTMVFKADKLMESSGTGAQLKETGIDLANPRTGARAVATHVVARHLGMENLVPRTEFAEHNGKIGTVSELAPGMALRSHHFRFVEPDASGRKIEDDEELERVQQLQQDNPDGFAQMGFVEEDDGSYRQLPPRSAKMDDVIVRVGGDVTDDDELAALNKLTENGDGESALRNLGIVAKDDGGYRRLDQVVTDPIEKAKLRAIPNDDLGAAGFARRESVYVRGRPADLRIDSQDPKMRRNLSNAQWLHASTHETDGHGGNMFADLDENGAVTGFKLIDPDQSFGPGGRGKDLPCFPGSSTRPVGNQADGLPVISKEFKRGLENVDLAALRQDLQGLLSSDEIDATVDRIKNLKELAGQLEQQGKVLDSDDDWASDAAQPPQDKPRQYLNRLGPRAGDVPPLLAARALARLKAPEVQQ